MLNYYDLSGKKFGKLTVKKFAGYHFEKSRKKNVSKWLCECECGGSKIIKRHLLIKGNTKSCGCLVVAKYKIDEKYFEKIDTQDKAYFYGFILTDGNIENNRSKRITIKIGLKDKPILESFRKYLKTNKPLETHKSRFTMYGNYKVKSGAGAAIVISNVKMVKDIIKLGLNPAKTKTVQFPVNTIIPHKYMHHCIRGIFDGDGTSGIGHIQIISGSKIFLSKFKYYLQDRYKINSYIIEYKRTVKATNSITNYWVLCISASFSGKESSGIKRVGKTGQFKAIPKKLQKLNQKLFYKTIYANCNKDLYLKRKKEKLKKYLFN